MLVKSVMDGRRLELGHHRGNKRTSVGGNSGYGIFVLPQNLTAHCDSLHKSPHLRLEKILYMNLSRKKTTRQGTTGHLRAKQTLPKENCERSTSVDISFLVSEITLTT